MLSVDLTISDCDGQIVVALSGELDVVDAEPVAAALRIAADRDRVIIADLARLTFLDASGVAALARARRQIRHTGGDLLLAAPQWQVRRVLEVAQPVDAFAVYSDVAEAMGSIDALAAAATVAAPDALLAAT
jgi:anti-sigma B factor antagonist